jgi:surface antigen Omp85-like protein
MLRSTSLVLLLLILCTPAAAQSTRVEAIAEEQKKKAGNLGTEGPSNAERVIRRVLISPLLAGGDGPYPWFGSVFPGTGMAVGAGYLKRLPNAASANLMAGISLNNSMQAEGKFSLPELWHGNIRVDGLARWTDARGVSFYGMGQDSKIEARERYDYQPTEVGGDGTLTLKRWLWVSGGYSFLDVDTQQDLPGPTGQLAPGIGEALQYNVTRGTVAIDWRNATGYSTRGGFYRATLARHTERHGRPFTFRSEEYEVVQLLPLVKEQFVLAFRGLLTSTDPNDGDEVPVMLGPFLGSGSTLRGYRNRRFTDRQRLLLTGEYRWRPSRYLDMAVFIDAGKVAAAPQQLNLKQLETAWGIGARLHGPAFTAVRFDLARGREGFGLVISGSQAF